MELLPSSRELRVLHLKAFPIFKTLSEQALRRLAEIASLRRYVDGEALFLQGESAAAFYLVLDGGIRVVRTGASGREQTLHMFHAGQLVGEVPVFRGGTYPATAISASETRALHIPRAQFEILLREIPDMALAMLAGVCERLRIFVDLVEGLALKDVVGRLAGYLLRLQDEQGKDTVVLPTTKLALATQLGTVPETLSRRLRTLQEEGLIKVAGRRIEILKRRNLAALADL